MPHTNATKQKLSRIRLEGLKSGRIKPLSGKENPYFKHGMTDSPEFYAWKNMINRCTNQKVRSYHLYGGRGIAVYPKWQHDFMAFFSHVGPRPSADYSLDRINNDGNYEPGNVRWATRKEQAQNRRTDTLALKNRGAKIAIANVGKVPWNKGRTGVYSQDAIERFRVAALKQHEQARAMRSMGVA